MCAAGASEPYHWATAAMSSSLTPLIGQRTLAVQLSRILDLVEGTPTPTPSASRSLPAHRVVAHRLDTAEALRV